MVKTALHVSDGITTHHQERKQLYLQHLVFVTPLLLLAGSSNGVHGSVHRKNILIYIQKDAMLHSLFLSGNCSTCFGWYHRPSSGAQTTVSTASGICHTFTAICRYRGGVETGLSVLWVAYAIHSAPDDG
jgi:hypothetical protein